MLQALSFPNPLIITPGTGYHSLFLPVLHPASRNTLVMHLKQDSRTYSQVPNCLAAGPPSARKHSLSRLESSFHCCLVFLRQLLTQPSFH